MLGGKLFKPKWQHKNPQIRRQAVLAMDVNDRAAQQAFVQLAQHDPDPDIRVLALKRIDSVKEIAKFVNQSEAEIAASACHSLAKFCQRGLDEAEQATLLALIDESGDNQDFLQQLVTLARDVAVRRKALEKINKPSLLAEIALNDDDLELRLAALKRIDKVSTLQRIVKQSRRKDKSVFAQAQQQLQVLQQFEQLPQELQQQAQELLNQLNAVLKLCQDKRQWQASEAQVLALKQEWHALRARWQELGQDQAMPQQTTLEQQFAYFDCELGNYRDKQQQQQAAYQQDALLIQQFRALLEQAQALKAQAESSPADTTAPSADPLQDWRDCRLQWDLLDRPVSELGKSEFAALKLRFGDIGQAIDTSLQAAKQLQQWQVKTRQLQANIDKLLQDEQLPTSADLRKLQKQWENLTPKQALAQSAMVSATTQQVTHKLSKLQQRVDEARQQRQQNSKLFAEALTDLKNAMQEGKAKHAINMLRRCEKLLPQSDLSSRDPLQLEFQRVRGEARELQDWRNWSNSPVKENICSEVEAILTDLRESDSASAGVSYSKVMQQIRDYRQEWNGLSHTESHSDKSLWKRFENACKNVEKICAGFFEQRDEQRKDNLIQRQQYCEKLAQYLDHLQTQALSEIDIKGLDKVIRTAQIEWRQLGVVETSEKDAINQQFKDIVSRLRDIQSAFRGENRDAKQALIERLEKLNTALDEDESGLSEAVETTKQIQSQWKQLGPASKEKELWQAFHTLGNQVFARLDKQREQEKILREKEVAELDAIIEELEQAHNGGDSIGLQQVNLLLQSSREKWQAHPLSKQHKAQQKRFDRAFAQVENLRKKLVARGEIEKRREWIDAFSRLSEMEASYARDANIDGAVNVDDLKAQYRRLAPETEIFIKQLYVENSADRVKEDQELLDKRKRLCISLEVLAGLPSPETDKAARMNYQVSVLAEKMKQGGNSDDWLQVTQSMRQWWSYGLTRQDSLALNQRLITAAQAFLEKIV